MVKAIGLKKYSSLLEEIKNKIISAQQKVNLSINHELILLYWDIGRIVTAKQDKEG